MAFEILIKLVCIATFKKWLRPGLSFKSLALRKQHFTGRVFATFLQHTALSLRLGDS
jgi:hypothetical protein